jgi:protein-L-isoaspartate(D-aspartate) O-methyltransferase
MQVQSMMASERPGPGIMDWDHLRADMVETQIRARGVRDPRVLDAMRAVPRHEFLPPDVQARAYDDSAVPIGYGQTISQPYVVAFMSEILDVQPEDRVLEIGTGCGYQTAVLAELAREVYSIEIVQALADRAAITLQALGYHQVHLRHGDGSAGWPEAAPFTRILVAAAPRRVPQTLLDQLEMGGLMIVPVGGSFDAQELTLIRRTPAGIVSREVMSVRFVPMITNPTTDDR